MERSNEHVREQVATKRVVGLVAPLGPVTTAPLLGTAGLYLEDQVFGLVADGVVYFRTDAHSEDRYDASGSRRFCYDMHAGHMAPTRYREVPQHVLECQDLTCAWAYEALATERW